MDDKLKNILEQNAFKVPDGYFESLENRLKENISSVEVETTENWIDRLVYQLHLRFSIPAISVLSLVAAVLYISIELDPRAPLVLNDNEITDYLLEEYDDDLELDLYEIGFADLNTENDLVLSDEDIITYLSEEASEEELMEYLP
ncbi:MAG: hypothetical protein CMP59_09785 [Flavobacteriales bacterium]|nr:hypothetical protein [Flavobacteriales bacterium]|tara:strand:+ start:66 stop:500 length:435 start_codon:yes stop_codon:yes gene_type:complete